MLTFEQSPFLGTANIVGKLQVRLYITVKIAQKNDCAPRRRQSKSG